MNLELKGRRALVTGGSRGIGKAVARLLAQEGAAVALLARNVQALDGRGRRNWPPRPAARWSASAPTPPATSRCETPWPQAVQQLGGAIDILVNAAAEPAGFAAPPKLAEITGTHFHAEMDTKVMGYCAARARWCPA